jgi:hypothetical protein
MNQFSDNPYESPTVQAEVVERPKRKNPFPGLELLTMFMAIGFAVAGFDFYRSEKHVGFLLLGVTAAAVAFLFLLRIGRWCFFPQR